MCTCGVLTINILKGFEFGPSGLWCTAEAAGAWTGKAGIGLAFNKTRSFSFVRGAFS